LYLDWTSFVRYDLNLTLGCHSFYYLAPFLVLDYICLVPPIHDKIKIMHFYRDNSIHNHSSSPRFRLTWLSSIKPRFNYISILKLICDTILLVNDLTILHLSRCLTLFITPFYRVNVCLHWVNNRVLFLVRKKLPPFDQRQIIFYRYLSVL
jgi:hypothetical protein